MSLLSSARSSVDVGLEFGAEFGDVGFGGDAVAEGGTDGVGNGFGLGRSKTGLGQGFGGVQGVKRAHRLLCLSTGAAKRNPPRPRRGRKNLTVAKGEADAPRGRYTVVRRLNVYC